MFGHTESQIELIKNSSVIPGYSSIFDRPISAQEYAKVNKLLSDAHTMPELYSAVQSVVTLPDASSEAEMRMNLLGIASAMDRIPSSDSGIGTILATEFIEFRLLPRLNTIDGTPQPEI